MAVDLKLHARPLEIWHYDPEGILCLTWTEQEQWCDTNCSGEWARSQGAFWFEQEKDYSYFVLRWC